MCYHQKWCKSEEAAPPFLKGDKKLAIGILILFTCLVAFLSAWSLVMHRRKQHLELRFSTGRVPVSENLTIAGWDSRIDSMNKPELPATLARIVTISKLSGDMEWIEHHESYGDSQYKVQEH